MDFTLNVTSKPVSGQKTNNSENRGGSKKRNNQQNDFSFNFTSTDKIKAVVARKRNIPSAGGGPTTGGVVFKKQVFENLKKQRMELEAKKDDISLNLVSRNDEHISPVISTSDFKKKKDNPVKKTDFKSKHVDKGYKPKHSSLFGNNPEVPKMGQRLVKPVQETVFTGASFTSLDIHPHCVKNLADILEIKEMTTVQQRSIPVILENRDVLVRSQTGSGKTLAYALPIVQKLQEIRPKLTRLCGIQAVIVVPTRELAVQTYDFLVKLLKPFQWIVAGYLCGGEKRKSEKARLRKGINILVGTPGRLCDHLLNTESLKFDTVKWLVLDEADRLLELGYERDVGKIVDAITKKVIFSSAENEHIKFDEETKTETAKPVIQTILLSATLTTSVEKLAGMALNNPLFIDTADVSSINMGGNKFEDAVKEAVSSEQMTIPSTVVQNYVLVPPKLRLVTLSGMIIRERSKNINKILVFMASQDLVDFHHDLMVEALTRRVMDEEDEDEDEFDSDNEQEDGLLAGARFFKLHGSMTQQERTAVFKAFRDAKSGIMLCTDVAGRGLDVPKVDLVIQFSAPQKVADYVHRVGRTARAGRKGRAVIFLNPNETDFIGVLEEKRIRIAQEEMQLSLDALLTPTGNARKPDEAATNLQHKFEGIVNDDKEMHGKACKAFVSWIRYYSSFPKDLRHIFSVKNSHMGHFAKSLGLKEPPNSFAKYHTAPKAPQAVNRLTNKDRETSNSKPAKRSAGSGKQAAKHNPKTICLTTSEFGSGLPPMKKRKV